MSGGEVCLPCLLYYMCLWPSVNHSSWAVLLLYGYSKSTCNSSGENGYAKLFNTPLNLLGQSQLVLLHIFYPLDLLSLSWSLLPHCLRKCKFFFSVMDGVLPVFFFFPPDSFTLLDTVATLWDCLVALLDLPFRSLSCFSLSLISEPTSTHCPFCHYDSHLRWMYVDSIPQILQDILLHTLHATLCLCRCKMHHPQCLNYVYHWNLSAMCSCYRSMLSTNHKNT